MSLAEGNTTVTCKATGPPNLAIAIVWYHNQTLVAQANESVFRSKYTIDTTSLGNSAIHSTLTITGLTLADKGKVTCVASIQWGNDFGEVEKRTTNQTATLIVLGEF